MQIPCCPEKCTWMASPTCWPNPNFPIPVKPGARCTCWKNDRMLQDLLSRTVLTANTSGVQVLIGGEGTWDELRQCSIILARYGSPEQATGTLGVLGPMRMSYGRSISMVRFISSLLSDLVAEQW